MSQNMWKRGDLGLLCWTYRDIVCSCLKIQMPFLQFLLDDLRVSCMSGFFLLWWSSSPTFIQLPMKSHWNETYLNQMSQSMLIPGHHLCDVNSYCPKGRSRERKRVGSELGAGEWGAIHIWGACASQCVYQEYASLRWGRAIAHLGSARGETKHKWQRKKLWLHTRDCISLFHTKSQFRLSQRLLFPEESPFHISICKV